MNYGDASGSFGARVRDFVDRITLKSTLPTDADEARQRLTSPNDEDDPAGDDHDQDSNPKSLPTLHARPRKEPASRTWIYIVAGLSTLIVLLTIVAFAAHKTLGFEIPILDTSQDLLDAQPAPHLDLPTDPRKALIVSSYRAQKVDWLKRINRPGHADNWEIFRYIGDAPEDTHALTVENPDGREALAYLTFIIDHYKNLPDYMVFVHGHYRSWHQPTPIQYKLWALNTTALHENGYFNIRCQSRGCTNETMFYHDGSHPEDHRGAAQPIFKRFWHDMMERNFGPIPTRIGRTCCAQFAVTKRAILSNSLKFWKDMRDPLLKNQTRKHPWQGGLHQGGRGGYEIGLYYEHVWNILMGNGFEFCPSDDTCNAVFFSDQIHCTEPPRIWRNHEGWKDIKCRYLEPSTDPDATNGTHSYIDGGRQF